MATTNNIIDECLKGIGEDIVSPVEMSREEVLSIVNQLYQNDIGKRLNNLASFSYDASDAEHTITNGIGNLPSDFLEIARVYDGDAPDHRPLTQIFDINDKMADDTNTTVYMLPNNSQIWFFGLTPSNTIKMYYHQKPTVLTDSSSSSPSLLKDEFHIDIFVARVKEVYAMRQNNTYDMMDMKALVVDLLNQIEFAHNAGKKDNSIQTIVDVYGVVF